MCNVCDKGDSVIVRVIFWDIRDVWVVGRALPYFFHPAEIFQKRMIFVDFEF